MVDGPWGNSQSLAALFALSFVARVPDLYCMPRNLHLRRVSVSIAIQRFAVE